MTADVTPKTSDVSDEQLERVLDLYLEKIITHDEDAAAKIGAGGEAAPKIQFREDLGFLPPQATLHTDMRRFEEAAEKIYLKQVLFIHRNLFYCERHRLSVGHGLSRG